MRRSTILFLVLAVCAAAGCIRLGFWQLSRLHERRARNAIVASRLEAPAADVRTIGDDTTTLRFRRVSLTGHPDSSHEFLLTLRGRNGSPGVDVITPLRLSGSDTAILVNRGWVYSPDGMTADLARWREADTMYNGYVEEFETSAARDSIRRDGIRRMDYAAIARTLPYPIKPFYIVATGDSTAERTGKVVRLAPPPLDEGPHASYAFQWFAFASIALLGGGVVAARSMPRGQWGQ